MSITELKWILMLIHSKDVHASGYLSTWPAHVSSQIAYHGRRNTSAEAPRLHGCEEISGLVAKPRFLDVLEGYLRSELRAVNMQQPNVQERKLQVYREVFDYFIEEFKTYKPLLSAIKNEYEITLAYMQDQIWKLKPLQAQLLTLSEQCKRQVLALHEEKRSEVTALTQESQRLQMIIDSMREQQESLQTQVRVLQSDLAAQYVAFCQERDARKLLIASTGNVSYRPENTTEEEENVCEDPVMLKLALRACRKDLTKAQIELNRMQAECWELVPRKDWEALQQSHQESLLRLQTLQADFDQVKAEYDTLLDVHKQVVLQRDGLQGELKALRGTSTPRPRWQDCADVLGGSERWMELSAGKSSQQLLGILVKKLGGKAAGPEEFFTGLGTEENVPVYLRYEGKLRNLSLALPDVVRTIKEVWKEKATVDEQREGQSELPEILHRHLERSHGEQAGAWAYSLMEACRQHAQEQPVSLFYHILTGKVDESVHHRQVQLQSRLLEELVCMDATQSGTLAIEEFRRVLEKAFPLKTVSEIEELLTAAQSEMNHSGNSISYRTLYAENADGGYRHFLCVLMNQTSSEKTSTSDI